MKEYLVKSNDWSYLYKSDVSCCKSDDVIEIPDGADILARARGKLIFYAKNEKSPIVAPFKFIYLGDHRWSDTATNPFCSNGFIDHILWQRSETEYLMQGKNGERLMGSVGKVKGVDVVNHPSHYSDSAIECIDAMEAMLGRQQFIGYLRGNMFKYQWRYQKKNGIEDLKKSEWYLNKLLEVENAGCKD